MKRRITITLMVIVTFLLYTALLQIFPTTVIKPNLMILLPISMGLMRGKTSGLLTGFFAGLLLDLFYGDLPGLNALLFMYVGFFTGFSYKVFFDEDIKVPMILAGIGDLAYNLVFYLVRFAFVNSMDFGMVMRTTIIPEAVMTVVFAIPIYKIYFLLNKKLVSWEVEEQQSPWLKK